MECISETGSKSTENNKLRVFIKIPIRIYMYVTVFLPLFSLIACILSAILINKHDVFATDCGVSEPLD
jgi:hypothetical protein